MRLLVVIGPSGSGKSTVVRELQRRGLGRDHPLVDHPAPPPSATRSDFA